MSDLTIPPGEVKVLGYRIVDMLVKELENPDIRPIYPSPQDQENLERRFGGGLPEHGQNPDELLDIIQNDLIALCPNYLHPRMLGYIASSPLPLCSLIESLVSGLRIFPYTWSLTPGSSMIEIIVSRWLGQMIGFSERSAGYMTTGGSWANLMAIAVARQQRCDWDVLDEGLGKQPPMVAYTSEQAHSCHDQSMSLLGLGKRYLRKIPVDFNYRIDVEALETAVLGDLKDGLKPFCVIGTAGTTNTGAVDSLGDLAEVADTHNLWYHIDGAYGAIAALDPSLEATFRDLSKADSLTIDPHKWLNIPFEAGCLLTQNWRCLSDTFNVLPPYLESGHSESHHDHWNHGFELTRSDRALKIWIALRQHGVSAYREMVCDHIKLARKTAKWLHAAPDFEVITEPSLSVCCFRYSPIETRSECNKQECYLNELNSKLEENIALSGQALMTGTMLKGKKVLRACIVNHRATWEGIEQTLKLIRELGQELHQGDSCLE